LEESKCPFTEIGKELLQSGDHINPEAYRIIIILVEGKPRDTIRTVRNPIT
jgi:hypothetical protein